MGWRDGGRGLGDVKQELEVLLKENMVLYNIKNNEKKSWVGGWGDI